jgi:hypothetical protein
VRLPTAAQGPQAGVAAPATADPGPLLQHPAAVPACLTLPRFSALYIVLRASPSTLMRTIFAQALGFFEPAGPVCTIKQLCRRWKEGFLGACVACVLLGVPRWPKPRCAQGGSHSLYYSLKRHFARPGGEQTRQGPWPGPGWLVPVACGGAACSHLDQHICVSS